MSVVRKHASGGSVTTTDYTELENYLKNKISKELTNKSIDFVEKALPNFIESMKSGTVKSTEYTPKVNWAGRVLIESPEEAENQLYFWTKENQKPKEEIVKAQNGDVVPTTFTFSKTKLPENFEEVLGKLKDIYTKSGQLSAKEVQERINQLKTDNVKTQDLTPQGSQEVTNKIDSELEKQVEDEKANENAKVIDILKEESTKLPTGFISGKIKPILLKKLPETKINTKDQLPINITETPKESKKSFDLGYRNIVDILNTGLLANSLVNIGKNYRLTNKALTEQLGAKTNLLSYPNIKVYSPNVSLTEDQISKANSAASKIANSISDIDKGLAYRAQIAKNVADIKLKSNIANQQQIEQQESKLSDIKNKIDQTNTQIVSANQAKAADIMSKFYQNAVNANLSKQNEINKFVFALSQNLKVSALSQNLKVPEYTNLSNEYNKFKEDLLDFEQRRQEDPTLTGSQEEKNLEIKKKLLNNKMREMLSTQSALQTKYQYGVYAKGGSLSDKITLENIKQNNKKELEELKQYYKKMLKSDDLLLKSLIKIFK